LQKAQTEHGLNVAGFSSGIINEPPRFISDAALERVEKSTFLVSHPSAPANCVGVGVFITKRRAVTAKHNLGVAKLKMKVLATLHDKTTIEMTVVTLGKGFDYAILESEKEHETHLEMYNGHFEKLTGTQLVLCSFLLAIKEELSEFSLNLKVMTVNVMGLSHHKHHILYGTTAFPGDSGGAIVVWDGKLVGIHLDSVNALQEKYERKGDVTKRMRVVEDSLENLACSVSEGFVGLLACVLESEFSSDV
jgi:hypothetical protein